MIMGKDRKHKKPSTTHTVDYITKNMEIKKLQFTYGVPTFIQNNHVK